MSCGYCSSKGCASSGCKSNGTCLTDGGCNKLNTYDWLAGLPTPSQAKPFNLVEVKFKGSRKDFYINVDNHYLEIGDMVSVETTSGGYDVGHVSLSGELVRMQMKKHNIEPKDVVKKIYRKANHIDLDKWTQAKSLEFKTMHQARKLALELRLSMKISDVEYQGDKSKATFFYTADGRVDFRELIKRFSENFKVRIEMRQIGMRQEASRLGGIGSCGRELCCSTWLTDFKTVSTSAARYQNLSINTLKLAGQCGKLKCCLNYELDSYMDALREIPDEIQTLETQEGNARLVKTDILKKIMWFSVPGNENWFPLAINKVKEIHALNKQGEKPVGLRNLSLLPSVEEEETLDYENVVGQDSLTRLDNRNKKKKKKSFTPRNQNSAETSPRPNQERNTTEQTPNQPNRPSGENRSASPRTNNNQRRNNNNRGRFNNNNNRNDKNTQ